VYKHKSLTDSRAEEERQWWIQLQLLADNDDVKGFFKLYQKYLEWNSVISPSRSCIHKMLRKLNE
jgi:hypothetical protein